MVIYHDRLEELNRLEYDRLHNLNLASNKTEAAGLMGFHEGWLSKNIRNAPRYLKETSVQTLTEYFLNPNDLGTGVIPEPVDGVDALADLLTHLGPRRETLLYFAERFNLSIGDFRTKLRIKSDEVDKTTPQEPAKKPSPAKNDQGKGKAAAEPKAPAETEPVAEVAAVDPVATKPAITMLSLPSDTFERCEQMAAEYLGSPVDDSMTENCTLFFLKMVLSGRIFLPKT